jgi:hypothetical protein
LNRDFSDNVTCDLRPETCDLLALGKRVGRPPSHTDAPKQKTPILTIGTERIIADIVEYEATLNAQ